jgi:hypothetical protein
MAKFLKLCEQYDPSNQDVNDAALWVAQILSQEDVPFTHNGDEIRIPTEYGVAVLKVVSFEKDQEIQQPEEDEQIKAGYGDISVMDRISQMASDYEKKGIGGKIINPTLRKAHAINKKMQKLNKQFIPAGEKALKRLEADLKAINSQSSGNVTY